MLDSLFAPAVPSLRDAMNFETARQRVTAHNIANVNTPGFQSRQVFRRVLAQKMGEIGALDEHLARTFGVQGGQDFEIATSDDPPVREDGNNVNFESQLTDLADEELRYRALTNFTARYFRGLKSVIAGDGR